MKSMLQSKGILVFITLNLPIILLAMIWRGNLWSTNHLGSVYAAMEEGGAEQTCSADDGSCAAAATDSSSSSSTKKKTRKIPPIPEIDSEGYIKTEYGVSQQIADSKKYKDQTMQRLQETHQYMHGTVYVNDPNMKPKCINRHELCIFWAAIGECDANPAYMKLQCAPSCFSCDDLKFEKRCPMPENAEEANALQPGDLNKMFEKIVSDPYYAQSYGTIETVLKPGMKTRIGDAPWVVTIDDFLTEDECETLIRLGSERGYERSKDVGHQQFDGSYSARESKGRTSSNAWCVNECYNDPTTKRVIAKIENLTGIPDDNSEYLQLLQYEVGQFYETHHDFITHHVNRQQGVRILTVFLYLNDVEEGGGTNFPELEVTVMPKRGRALIWPSVKDKDPNKKDYRTDHQALPVEKGIKYGANAWLHLRDFKTPYDKNCI